MTEQNAEKSQEPQAEQAPPISLNDRGMFEAKSSQDVIRIGRSALASGALPNHISSINIFVVAWNVLSGMGLQPMSFMDKTWWNPQSSTLGVEVHAAFAAAQNHPDFEGVEEWLVDREYKVIDDTNWLDLEPMGAICVIKRKNRPDVKTRFSLKHAEKLSLAHKPNWVKQTGNMLKIRARGLALKEQFGDVIGGVLMKGYDEYNDKDEDMADKGSGQRLAGAIRQQGSQKP